MIFIWTSISIKGHNIVILIKIQKEWEKWTPIPIFPIEATKFLICFLINHCNHNNSNKLYYSIFYLVNLLLDYSTVSRGFDIHP